MARIHRRRCNPQKYMGSSAQSNVLRLVGQEEIGNTSKVFVLWSSILEGALKMGPLLVVLLANCS